MGLILDTSALVAWERALNAGQTVALDESEGLVLPAVVWAEALAGVCLADSTARCLGFGVLVGPRDEAHFRRISGLDVRVLTTE